MLLKKFSKNHCKQEIAHKLPKILAAHDILLSDKSYLDFLYLVNLSVNKHFATSWNLLFPKSNFKITGLFFSENPDLRSIPKHKLMSISNAIETQVLDNFRDTETEAKVKPLGQQILTGFKAAFQGYFLGIAQSFLFGLIFKRTTASQTIKNMAEYAYENNKENERLGYTYVILVAPIFEELLYRYFIPEAMLAIKNLFIRLTEVSFKKDNRNRDAVIDNETSIPGLIFYLSSELFVNVHEQYNDEEKLGIRFLGWHFANLRNENAGSIVPGIACHISHNLAVCAHGKLAKRALTGSFM